MIDANGDVGIGTSNPGYRCDVYDTVANIAIFRSTITSYARVIIRAGATGDAQLCFQNNTASTKWTIGNDGGDSDKFKIEAGGGAFGTSPLVCILSDGKVGIGTAAPGATLQVGTHTGTMPSNTALFLGENDLRFSTTNTNAAYGSYLKPGYDAGPTPDISVLTFGTRFNTTDTDVLTLYGNEVGIGETTPNSPLVVISPDNTDHNAIIGAYTNNLSVGVELHHYGLRGATTTADGSTVLDTNQKLMLDAKGTGHLLLQTYGGTGNVGIGTTTPATLFDAKSSRTHNFIGRFVNTSTVGWGAYIEGGGDSADYSLLIRNQASSDLFAIMGDGEIRVANQTLVDNANTNYKMTFPDNSGIAMGSAYTFANIYGSSGNLYLRANAYPANTGSTSKIYLQTANSSGGQASDVVVNNGQVGIGIAAPATLLELSSNAVSATDIAASTLLRLTNTASALSGGDIIGALQFYNSDGSDDSPGVAASVYAIAGSSGGSGRLEFRTKMQNSEGAPAGMTMFLNEVGKVGIGTAAPSAILHVQGTMRLTGGFYDKDNSLGSAGQILTTNGSATYWSAAGSGTISGSGTDNYIPRFNGTTAIENSNITDDGTTIKFGVASNDASYIPVAVPNTFNTGWNNTSDSHATWINFYGYQGSTSKFRDFKIGNGKATAIATFDGSSGNVGIGTAAPADTLSIQVPDGTTKGIFFQDGSSSVYGTKLKYEEAGNKFFIEQIENGSQTGLFTMQRADGNVGIGTASPGSLLHVYGGNIKISSTDDKPQLVFGEAAADRWVIGNSNAPNNYFVVGEGSDIALNERLVIAPTTGSVGIGTDAPSETLHVAGRITAKVGSGNEASIVIDNNASGKTGDAYLRYVVYNGVYWATGIDNSDVDKFKISKSSDLGTNDFLTIDTAGSVGIGTTGPNEKLEIKGDSTYFRVSASDGSEAVRLGADSSGDGQLNGD